jgi:hypothetical protein
MNAIINLIGALAAIWGVVTFLSLAFPRAGIFTMFVRPAAERLQELAIPLRAGIAVVLVLAVIGAKALFATVAIALLALLAWAIWRQWVAETYANKVSPVEFYTDDLMRAMAEVARKQRAEEEASGGGGTGQDAPDTAPKAPKKKRSTSKKRPAGS